MSGSAMSISGVFAQGYVDNVIGNLKLSEIVTQVNHGFVVGDVLYLNGTTYTKAIATSVETAEVCGIVSEVTNGDTFTSLFVTPL